jgi:hypothetical protein
MTMNIAPSVFGLAKTNNGFFKSEKQAAFLISQMEKFEGCIGHTSGYNSNPIFAKWDEKGIVEIVRHSRTKKGCTDIIMFQRSVEGFFTELQLKEIKHWIKLSNKWKKEMAAYEDNSNWSKKLQQDIDNLEIKISNHPARSAVK